MSERSRRINQDQSARVFDEHTENAEMNAKTLRDFLVQATAVDIEAGEAQSI